MSRYTGADAINLARTHETKRRTGRLPTVATNCSVSSVTYREALDAPRYFLLETRIRKSGDLTLGCLQYFCLMDGRHLVHLSTGSMTRLEDYHNLTFTWGNIFFQTTLGTTGFTLLQIPPVDLLQMGLPQVTRDGQQFTKFTFVYESAKNNCDERLLNGARALGVKVHDNTLAGCCLIL
ncbi:hypothetical protein BGZ90_008341 [Linnemannia elongata]|nr:hypothetical protein BGZ90_008341 [Linnemannia elongata]